MVTIQPNLFITDEDIEVNPELWVQKVSMILFNDTAGKNYWNKNYTFIPHHKRFNEAVKWIRDTEFPEYSCRITKNENNEIEIVTQNLFGDRRVFVDREREIIVKIRAKIYEELNNVEKELKTGQYSSEEISDIKEYKSELGEGLRAKSYGEFSGFSYGDALFREELEELKKVENKKKRNADKNYFSYDFARPDLVILWRKQIYFVREWQYINNYKLYVKIWARKCVLQCITEIGWEVPD